MHRTIIAAAATCALGLVAAGPAAALPDHHGETAAIATDVHAPFDKFLSRYVVKADGATGVRYGKVTDEDHAKLKAYIDTLESETPSRMSEDERLAYYFNLYNAAIIDLTLENYPLKSIKSVGGGLFNRGPWKMEVVTVEGKALSFDDIEHDRVRGNYDEPRVHYAFNCASIGCPNIAAKAWRAETLDRDLNTAARAFVAHPRGVSIKNGKVRVSSIYDWFQDDFGGTEQGVLDHVATYATGEKKAAIQAADGIAGYGYDWDLNVSK